MVIKGGARGGPVGLAAHLERTDENERVTLIGIHGLAARDVEGALIEMDALGAGLRTSRTLYHVSINVGYGDRMTEENWQIASNALREKLDLAGQPYIEIEHEKKGRTHRHFVVSRADIEHNRAIRADHNYRTHEEVARDLERQFGHERVQGAHVERDGKDRPERTPSYAEMQQAKRTGMTPQEAKEFVTGLWQTTDSGKAFNAALEAHGWMLARGDKRDFVLIDPHGETHSLARRVDSAKAKDVRARLADIDLAMLPSVEAARSLQKERDAERAVAIDQNKLDTGRYGILHEAGRQAEAKRGFETGAARTTEPRAPIWDRDAETWAADERIADAAIAANAEARKGRQRPERSTAAERDAPAAQGRYADLPTPEQRREDVRPLGKTAGEIRTAWTLSRSAEQLEEAFAARGITLAEVSAEEARQSERTAAFARELGNFARVLKEGEIVAVNARGVVHRLDQRTTGDLMPEIEARLAGIDRAGLLSVTDAKEVMQEASRATYAGEAREWREMNTPLTGIETTIADALTSTMTGTEFAETLDEAGITITRVTATDVKALEALRAEADLARTVAHTDEADIFAAMNVVSEARHFAPVREGDYAAVTRAGDVFRLNPTALDFEDVEQRLADVQPRLPSVIEARAQNEIVRENSAEFWAEMRATNAEDRAASDAAFEGDRALHRHVAAAEHSVEDTLYAADDAVDVGFDAAAGLAKGFAKAVEKVLSGFFSFFGLGEPKLTPMQAELTARANEELAEARAVAAAAREKDAAQDWQIFEHDRQQQQEEMQRDMGYRERPGDRERERERDWP